MANERKIQVELSAIDAGLSAVFAKAEATMQKFSTASKRIESNFSGVAAAFSKAVGPITAAIIAMEGMNKLVAVTREFDKISAGLITATGSADGAKTAFAALEEIAARTPYDLAQVSEGFIKLVNLGLEPSERAMVSYGDTASAMGKNLNQMIEAVADASTGEFERLKEFGIKAKSEGDKVTFTFRGVATTVGKNAAEIEQYLIKLGETNFGGAMARQMSTLDGAISNLGDSWDAFAVQVGTSSKGLITESLSFVTEGLQGLIYQMKVLNDTDTTFWEKTEAGLKSIGKIIPRFRQSCR